MVEKPRGRIQASEQGGNSDWLERTGRIGRGRFAPSPSIEMRGRIRDRRGDSAFEQPFCECPIRADSMPAMKYRPQHYRISLQSQLLLS